MMGTILKILVAISMLISLNVAQAQLNLTPEVQEKLQAFEQGFDGKIGVYALDTNNQNTIAYRADQHFNFQSTSKLIAVGALLQKSSAQKKLLSEKMYYQAKDLVFWHPITGQHLKTGITLQEAARAAISYSDNTAVNLIIKKLGGPQAITDFAHSIGNKSFTMEHYEPDLNSNPAIAEDFSTPKDMALSLQKLTLGKTLGTKQSALLIQWLKENTTGDKRIRAGTPIGFTVGDKTGSGSYGIANDIALIWGPQCKPIVLSIYTVRAQKDAPSRDDIVASTAALVLNELIKKDACLQIH